MDSSSRTGLLLLLSLMLTPEQSAAADFRVLVAIEDSSWLEESDSFVRDLFNRRIDLNWRLKFNANRLTPVVLRAGGTTGIGKLVCDAASSAGGAAGLLAVGGCPFLAEINILANSLQLPFIGVPTALCRVTGNNDFGFISGHDPSVLIDASVSVLQSRDPDTAVLYYDSKQDPRILEEAQAKLTNAGISSLTFSVDLLNSTALVDQMKRLVKNKIRHFLVIANEPTVQALLRSASETRVMQPNYFWVIVDTGLSLSSLLPAAIPNSNIALVRGGAFGLDKPGACPSAVLDVFPQCNVTSIKISQVRLADAAEALAKALSDSLSSHAIAPSNLSCLAKQNWTWGRTLNDAIAAISNYDTFRGVVGFNSTSKYFIGQDVQVFGTWNEKSAERPLMQLSGRFSVATRRLTVLTRVRGSSVVFPNTFLGFKNETIIICSPFAPPYTYHEESFPNGTVILGGMVRDLIDKLAERMEFRYIAQNSADRTFGIVPPGSNYATGCVGEVQNGTVTLGGGPFGKSVNRAAVVEYSSAFFEDSIALLVHRPPPASKLWNLLRPLQLNVWITLGASVVLAAIVTWALAYFSPFSAWNLGLDYACADEVWLQEYVWISIGSFLQQGQDFNPFAMSPRTALAFWWLFAVIILAVYTGDLASDLVVSNEVLSIKTLQDLADSQTVTPAVGEGSFTWNLIQASARPEFRSLSKRLVTFQGPRGCREMVLSSNSACMIDFSFAALVYNQFCDKVYLGEEKFYTITAGFIWQPDSYFGDLFNFNIERLYESGFIWRSFENSVNSSFGCASTNSVPPGQPISLEGSGACFILLAGCFAAGLILLLLEVAWVRFFGKSPLDCAAVF